MATLNFKLGTTTNRWAFGDYYQRYAFYALGRFWVFYSDGTNMVWRTSTDGITPSAAQTVKAWTAGYHGSIAFDGANVHYVHNADAAGSDNLYRMGSIDSDGNITWLAAEQIAVAIGASDRSPDPSIAVDSNGFPWIAYSIQVSATRVATAWITKSKTKDGTWTAEDVLFTAPYRFSASTFLRSASPTCWCAAAPMSGGQMYAMVQAGISVTATYETDIKGRLWDGSAWGNEETVAAPIDEILNASFSPVVDSHDNIFLTYRDYEPVAAERTGYYTIRTKSTGLWSTPVLHLAANTTGGQSVTCIDTNDIVYHFYQTEPTAKHIYYKRYVNGAWEAVTDWITETQAFGDEFGQYQSVALVGALGRIIYTYVTLTVSPFDVKMAALEILNTRGWAM